MKKETKDLLVQGLGELKIDVDTDQIELFDTFLKELLKWNSKYNLTAITNEKDIIIKHFLDSAIISKKIPCICDKMIDIGSGAGFPTLVLKILKPDVSLTSLDSNEKKIFFQKNVIRKLKLDHIKFIVSRAEDSSFIKDYNNYFECAIVRALKQLNEILRLAYPIVKKGGRIFILKGKKYKYELEELNGSKVGGRFKLIKIEPYILPFIKREHFILTYQKK
jgi:16S rRNA (guanine527-N7)-methyltransferase